MRPAQTGQGIISEGKLDAGEAAGWRMLSSQTFVPSDRFVNYLPLFGQSQENLCIAHIGFPVRLACGT
jgi:hypothetical protein